MDQHRRHAGRREPDGHHAGGLQAQENSGKMNRKQLGILIGLGAVIGALSLYVSRRNAASYQSSGEGGAGRKLLPDFPINDVARIGIKQGTNELNLVRQDDNWTVRERYGYPANFQEIRDLLRKIWELKVVQTEQVGPSQFAKLELTEPGNGTDSGTLVEFKDKSDKAIKAVLLGKKHMRKSENASPLGGSDGWPEETSMHKPIVAKIETFDGFAYAISIGTKTNEDNYYIRTSVSADFPKERAAGKDEKPEDKEKLDKEFKDKTDKLEDKLKQEKAFEKWTYLVSKWTVDPLLKERKDLLAEKKEEPKKEEKPAATNVTTQPKIVPPLPQNNEPKKEDKPAEKKPESDQ